MKNISLIITLIILPLVSFSQENLTIKGIIFHKENKQRVADVAVNNTKNKYVVKTDNWGTFNIQANIGDTLTFYREGFATETKIIETKGNLIIYLNPQIFLDEVLVKGQSKQSEQQEILEGYRSKGIFFDGKPPLLAGIFSPLTAIHELFSKDASNLRKFSNYIERENTELAIDRKFNKSLIVKHTDIKEEDVSEFMHYYRPSIDKIKSWNDYDMIKYIKGSYQQFKNTKNIK